VGTEPSPHRPKEEVVTEFDHLEASTARIAEFDAAFRPPTPRAVAAVMLMLEREGRR